MVPGNGTDVAIRDSQGTYAWLVMLVAASCGVGGGADGADGADRAGEADGSATAVGTVGAGRFH